MKILKYLILAGLVAFAACSSGVAEPEDKEEEDGFSLMHVNGTAPPGLVYQDTGLKVEIWGETLVLKENGTFNANGTRRYIYNSQTPPYTHSYTVSGTWRNALGGISFSDPQGQLLLECTTSADTLRCTEYSWNKNALTYRKK